MLDQASADMVPEVGAAAGDTPSSKHMPPSLSTSLPQGCLPSLGSPLRSNPGTSSKWEGGGLWEPSANEGRELWVSVPGPRLPQDNPEARWPGPLPGAQWEPDTAYAGSPSSRPPAQALTPASRDHLPSPGLGPCLRPDKLQRKLIVVIEPGVLQKIKSLRPAPARR